MHKKYAKDGLVAMSVDLDDPMDQQRMQNVRAFLTEQQPEFVNFVLDEKQEVWQEKLKIVGAPAIFVFGRDGKVAKKYEDGEEYKEIEPFVVVELKKKE
jgi:hypothetical protein